ncbi:MAG: hypothetical protein ACYDH6_24585 [Acidimicrobiales bacterium]
MAAYGEARDLEFYPLVKATPVITESLSEAMCVAGIERPSWSREPGSWVRVFPVPFRDLVDEQRFRKYQPVRMRVRRDSEDRRPESWTPAGGDILQLGEPLSTADAWSARRALVGSVEDATMCELVARNREGHKNGVPSLAVVRPAEPPDLQISPRDVDQLRKWRARAQALEATPSLFDDPGAPRRALEVVSWRFRYIYRCLEPGCRRHEQTIVDWEIVAHHQRVKAHDGWEEAMRIRWVDDLWTGKDSVLFVGNQHQHPQGFLVLGVFWPPDRPFTPQLWNS